MSKPEPKPLSYFDSLGGLETDGELIDVELKLLSTMKDQPRKHFDAKALEQLSESIKRKGVQNPLLVRRLGSSYEIVSGERRYRAAKQAGLKTVPVLVKNLSDIEVRELALLENLQRQDLNPYEETTAVLDLLCLKLEKSVQNVLEAIRAVYDEERGRTGNNVISNDDRTMIRDVFRMIGRFTPASFHVNRVPLLSLPPDVQDALRSGELHYTKAVLLARVSSAEDRHALLQRALDEDLAVAELRALIKTSLVSESPSDEPIDLAQVITATKRQLTPKRVATLPAKQQSRVRALLNEIASILSKE